MLNINQKKALNIFDKPLIVIAGPGSGKTTLITEKIKKLILDEKYKPQEVLAITFTNKAAEEMSMRVESLIENTFNAKTFHKFCLEIIEDYQKHIPYIDKNYVLIDEAAQLLFFLENMDKMKFNSIEVKNNYNILSSDLVSSISKLKDFSYSLKDFEKFEAKDLSSKLDVLIAYSQYELYKKNNFVDFGDLQLYVLELLEKNDKIRKEIQKKYKYILVDEFQDTNKIQLDIIKLVSGKNNITVVGDLKQSIYAFRGANFENLQIFEKHYSNHEKVYLSENYRCSKAVLKVVNQFVEKIGDEDEKLNCNLDDKGFSELVEAKSEKAQHSFIAQKIMQILDKNKDANIGVLFRRKVELREVASYLKKAGINFNALEAMNFFELPVIKEILMQCTIISSPKDAITQVFKLLIDEGVSPIVVRKISRKSSLKEKSIYEILDDNDLTENKEEQELISGLKKKLDRLINLRNSNCSMHELLREIIFTFNNYQNAIYLNSKDDIFAINKFLEFADNYLHIYKNHDLARFITVCENTRNLDISYDEEDNLGGVSLMTIHASKGKEFDYVIMPYLNDRRFPTTFKRSKFELFEESKQAFIEEEKRLFFVGLSRAKKELYLSYVKKFEANKFDSRASDFLYYLDLNKSSYDNEVEELTLSIKDEVKVEIANKIKNYILSDSYSLAKKELDLLEGLFTKKDLNRFMNNSHPDYDFYKDKLNGKSKDYNIGINKDKMVYSVSQLKTYESCPKKYLYSYVFKIPSEAKHYFDFGTSVHSVVEDLILEMDKYPDEVLFARGVSMLKQKWISKGYLNSKQERDYFEMGVKSIKTFIAKQRELEKQDRKTVKREEKFFIDFEGRRIMGFIDRVDEVAGKLEILDYKTSNSMENEKDLKENLQLYVYYVAAKQLFKESTSRVGLWYLVHNKIVDIDVLDIQADILKEKTLKLIKGIEKGDFKACPSHFSCKFCDYSRICKDSY